MGPDFILVDAHSTHTSAPHAWSLQVPPYHSGLDPEIQLMVFFPAWKISTWPSKSSSETTCAKISLLQISPKETDNPPFWVFPQGPAAGQSAFPKTGGGSPPHCRSQTAARVPQQLAGAFVEWKRGKLAGR